MARLDTLFDDIVTKAKEFAAVAGEKTSEVVELGRLKYRQNQVASQLEKVYAKLGAIVYEAKQNGENFDNLIDKAVSDLSSLNTRYDQLEEAIALVGKQNALPADEFIFDSVSQPESLEDLDDLDCAVCNTPLDVNLQEEINQDINVYPVFADQEDESSNVEAEAQRIAEETKQEAEAVSKIVSVEIIDEDDFEMDTEE